jgi:hypothetical protein
MVTESRRRGGGDGFSTVAASAEVCYGSPCARERVRVEKLQGQQGER